MTYTYTYTYNIKPIVHNKIFNFYANVAKKYRHAYSLELMNKNIHDVYDGIYKIENGLLRKTPTKPRWKNYFMANTSKWYYAYKIENNIITIVDVCHTQNMKESILRQKIMLQENKLQKIIRKSIKKILNII